MHLLSILLRLTAVAFVPVTLFIISNAARRASLFERYSWAILAISIVSLSWLSSAAIQENSKLLVLIYPSLFGLCFLLGPAFYFAITGKRITNWTFTILHIGTSACIFISTIYSSTLSPLHQEDFELLFKHGGVLTALPRTILGDHQLLVYLLPVHFGAYAFQGLRETKEHKHLFILLPIVLSTLYFIRGFNIDAGVPKTAFDFVILSLLNTSIIVTMIRFFLIDDTPRAQYDRKIRLNIDLPDFEHILSFLETKTAAEVFCEKRVSLLEVSRASNISTSDWKNYLECENISFTTLKKTVRIKHVERLVQEGFLEQFTVDSLAAEIGYSSRSSFYSAYKEVTGEAWGSQRH